LFSLRRLLIGLAIRSSDSHGQHISIPIALAVLSSDALSSVAYATEAMVLILMVAGTMGVAWALPCSSAIS
jgi:hypothetical protein